MSPAAFADTYQERPTAEICVGLRTIAESDLATARSQAARWATQLHPDVSPEEGELFGPWIESYNDALLRWIIARGTCDPNNVDQPPEVWNVAPEDQVREALTADGVRYLIDEWEKMRIGVDPTVQEASEDVVLRDLPNLLPYAHRLSAGRRGRAMRLMAFVLGELRSVAPGDDAAQTP